MTNTTLTLKNTDKMPASNWRFGASGGDSAVDNEERIEKKVQSDNARGQ